DARRKCLRALPIDYPALCAALQARYSFRPQFDPRPDLERPVRVAQQARSYQSEALGAWGAAGHRGVVVLPTCAGKTLVGLLALAALNTRTLVCERLPAQLPDERHMTGYRTEQIAVALTGAERTAYARAAEVYRAFLRRHRISMRSGADHERQLIWRSGNDPRAREALLAHQAARKIALTASGKMDVVAGLLDRHRDDRVLIFSEYNSLVDDLGRRFCLPVVTHKTPAQERKAILDGFRSGRFSKLATGRVLNEGVDLPDANVAIILSGSATRREFIQRLGRVLRPKQTEAVLYEVVTEDSTEEGISRRRQSAPASAPATP